MCQLWQTVRSAQSHTPQLRIRQVHLEHGAHLEARDNDQNRFVDVHRRVLFFRPYLCLELELAHRV